MLSTETSQNDR